MAQLPEKDPHGYFTLWKYRIIPIAAVVYVITIFVIGTNKQ